jgi:hypothetical protein
VGKGGHEGEKKKEVVVEEVAVVEEGERGERERERKRGRRW